MTVTEAFGNLDHFTEARDGGGEEKFVITETKDPSEDTFYMVSIATFLENVKKIIAIEAVGKTS